MPDTEAAPGTMLIAGATSRSGHSVARRLVERGHGVHAVSRDAERLGRLQAEVPGVEVSVADLTDPGDVAALPASLHAAGVAVHGVIHLVGGFRQSETGISGQTEEDWKFLEASLTSLRLVSREFEPAIGAAPAGRLIAVSSTATSRPRAGNASYVALKAAAEAWVRAVADGWAGGPAAATIIATASLAGKEEALGDLVVDILRAPAATVNGQRIVLR